MKHVSLLCGAIFLALLVISAPGSAQASCPDPYCDSVSFDQCLLICPAGDITFTVTVKDSCGDPVCDPNLWLDFTNCFATPCSTQTDWPIVYPVSCDAATGEHIFKIKAYAVDCANCLPDLYVNGLFCQPVRARFLSSNGDECVTQDDWFPALPCNDYNCDGLLTADDQQILTDHIDHCCGPPTDTCLVDTLTINTGWDHTTGSVYPPGSWDPNWTVTCDPDPLTGEPRPANVIATYGAWQPALSNSSWISAYTDPTNDVNGLYCYELCFCLEQGFTNAELFVELRADDSAVVYLNGTPIVSTPAGSFGTATPTTHLETDQSLFQPGQNCIRVEAYNLQAVAAGLNLAGHVTADGLGVEELACCDSTGSLTGFKWFDYNADCVRQSNEPKLGGWTINVSPGGYSTTTDSLGNYYFTGIPAGTYTVTEVPQTPYAQVCPPGGSYNVTLGAGQVIAGLDFGNAYDCDLANPGPSCDSTIYDPCMVVCPNGDIPWVVTLVDSCGNPVCDDSTYVELNACQATPCPNSHPDWPRIYPDSCDPTTGEHFFHPKSGNPDCIDCFGVLYVGGGACGEVVIKHLDNNGDFCVGSDDWFAASCNDYNCDGSVDSTDLALHQAHTTHCCDNTGCPPGDAFCDSVTTDPCVVICPKGDITHVVTVKDSCGNPVCDLTGGVYMDFSNCPSVPCQDPTSSWPQVLPDSCDPATGEHFFNPAAGSQDCVDCSGTLVVNGSVCRDLIPRFLDVTGDLCVFPDDWLGNQLLCNDYNCDGTVNADDQAIHTAHLDHCCDNGGCQPGAPFCDSVTTDPCMVICPEGDITHVVTVTDSCGNPVCDPDMWIDFSDCPTNSCPDSTGVNNWPIVYPDSCDPATGEHFFNPAAGSQDCIGCEATLYVNGDPCRNLDAKFLDIDGDLCVTDTDFLSSGALCNDYNCDGVVDATDQTIHAAHLGHCCGSSNEINGYKWHDLDCDGEWDTGEPPLAGWSISLYQGTTFIASTTTNAAGEYSFSGLAPGAYRVTETVTSGWVQTYPPTVYHDVTVSGVVTGVNFGNVEDDCQYNLTSSAQVAGTMDNFSGPEPSSPGADLLPAMTCPLGATHFFDSALTNQCWGHTFSDFFDTTCCVQGGQLCLRVAATGAIPDTDALAFFEDGQAVWGISMNDLVALATGGSDVVWSTGDTITVCLDLANLPPSALGVTNVLATLHDGDFDIRIQDDTEVDWMELRVEHCCPSCCVIRGDINNDGSGPDITDLTFFVNYLFGGGSAPPCLEQADANGDGSGPDITDLTFLVSYLFGGGTAPPPCP